MEEMGMTKDIDWAAKILEKILKNNVPPATPPTSTSTAILREWFVQHCGTARGPYPTATQKKQLALRTNLSISQISTFMSNARRPQRGYWSSIDRKKHAYLRKKSSEDFNYNDAIQNIRAASVGGYTNEISFQSNRITRSNEISFQSTKRIKY